MKKETIKAIVHEVGKVLFQVVCMVMIVVMIVFLIAYPFVKHYVSKNARMQELRIWKPATERLEDSTSLSMYYFTTKGERVLHVSMCDDKPEVTIYIEHKKTDKLEKRVYKYKSDGKNSGWHEKRRSPAKEPNGG